MTEQLFNGELYNDDRMFVLYVCKCLIVGEDATTITTTICHDSAPAEHKWCLVTYRNTARYPVHRVDHFDTEQLARSYQKRIEPTVPLISLGGKAPVSPLDYDQFVEWKARNKFSEYDFRSMYTPGGHNHRETVISSKRSKPT